MADTEAYDDDAVAEATDGEEAPEDDPYVVTDALRRELRRIADIATPAGAHGVKEVPPLGTTSRRAARSRRPRKPRAH